MTFCNVINKQVNMLQRLLEKEEKVHEILDMVNNRPNNSAISIPNFLPPKVIYNVHLIFFVILLPSFSLGNFSECLLHFIQHLMLTS